MIRDITPEEIDALQTYIVVNGVDIRGKYGDTGMSVFDDFIRPHTAVGIEGYRLQQPHVLSPGDEYIHVGGFQLVKRAEAYGDRTDDFFLFTNVPLHELNDDQRALMVALDREVAARNEEKYARTLTALQADELINLIDDYGLKQDVKFGTLAALRGEVATHEIMLRVRVARDTDFEVEDVNDWVDMDDLRKKIMNSINTPCGATDDKWIVEMSVDSVETLS